MGLFNLNREPFDMAHGGAMNVIRCDIPDYLIWRWHPDGVSPDDPRASSIRWGSSLRVRNGEVAVFMYSQQNGAIEEFIEGPFDRILSTMNLPGIANIVGLAYGGGTPFQAEIYFINLAGNIQIKFGVPYFDVYDPRFMDFGVPMAVRGAITFKITDYREFIKLNRLTNFDMETFKSQIRDATAKYVKQVVTNAPIDAGIPVVQIERRILEINDLVSTRLSDRLKNDFGVTVNGLDISAIEVDRESEGYMRLRAVTADLTAQTVKAQTEVNIRNLQDTQRINAENMEESLRINREEMQRRQRLASETAYLGAHAIDRQAEVLGAAADSLGTMGQFGGGGEGGGMNIAGMMTGMMMGGAMGGQMADMMNTMGNVSRQAMMNAGINPGAAMNPSGAVTPPPVPEKQWMLFAGGIQSGPYTPAQMRQLAEAGQLTDEVYVWTAGMAEWKHVPDVPEINALRTPQPPTPPGMPQLPGNE